MSIQLSQVYLGQNDVDSEKASKILNRLNSLNSTEEIMGIFGSHEGKKILGNRIAQRILKAKTEIGKFKDLNQVAVLPGIGAKRFVIIMSALADSIE